MLVYRTVYGKIGFTNWLSLSRISDLFSCPIDFQKNQSTLVAHRLTLGDVVLQPSTCFILTMPEIEESCLIMSCLRSWLVMVCHVSSQSPTHNSTVHALSVITIKDPIILRVKQGVYVARGTVSSCRHLESAFIAA